MSKQETVEVEKKEAKEKVEAVEKVERIVFPHYGDKFVAFVKDIERGKFKHFVDLSKKIEEAKSIGDFETAKRLEDKMERLAVKITFYIPELGVEASDIIVVSYHHNSRFMQLAHCYPEGIGVGDKVYVLLTEKGRFKIVCPSKQA